MSPVGIGYALAAAVLFGLSTPAAKLLLGATDPWLLAGLFYVGSGLGLAAWRLVRSSTRAKETALVRADVPWLAGAIIAGGVIGPILLMTGLSLVDASTASLLLTLEGVITALIAWFAFGENFDRRIVAGMLSIVAGAAVLAWPSTVTLAGALGPLAIIGACLAWGIDNNLTRKVSLADPVQTAMLKGLAAGPVAIALALWRGASWPAADAALLAGVVGFLGYGCSLVLFVLALRHVGTARTAAYFSTAPFIGAVAALPLLGEPLTLPLVAAALLMGIGVWLHVSERHLHEHEHERLAHTHRHWHDAHHQHAHTGDDPPGEPHSHPHVHAPLRHAHPHVPDAHHRHRH